MFNAIGAFTKAFSPVNGGYLYYFSAKSGGRLVTVEEFDVLVEQWRRVAGALGILKAVAAVFLVGVLWIVILDAVSLPHWADDVFTALVATIPCAWIFWASFAPWRLVRDRPEIVPPRPMTEVRQNARANLHWRSVLSIMLISCLVFWFHVLSRNHSLTSWLWLCGSGLMFVAYLWISVLKLTD